jgi:molecular chaperone GrpE
MIPSTANPSKSEILRTLARRDPSLKWAFFSQYSQLEQATLRPMSDPKAQSEVVPPSEPQEAKSLDELLAEAQTKLDEQREALLRALADAENARKRAQSDITQARKYAAERIVEDLLQVMDGLEATLGASSASADALRTGVELTQRQLRSAFDRAGVTDVNPAPGQRFDPHRHQAMAAVESDQEPNTVVAVLQKGYALHDRVVRPALVSVAKAKAVENGAGNPTSDSNLAPN